MEFESYEHNQIYDWRQMVPKVRQFEQKLSNSFINVKRLRAVAL